jgi:hypothetical protein
MKVQRQPFISGSVGRITRADRSLNPDFDYRHRLRVSSIWVILCLKSHSGRFEFEPRNVVDTAKVPANDTVVVQHPENPSVLIAIRNARLMTNSIWVGVWLNMQTFAAILEWSLRECNNDIPTEEQSIQSSFLTRSRCAIRENGVLGQPLH